jgi:manganese/zinc/iron transport system substrate-binding protein
MVADLARQVGGDRVQVIQLMEEGIDPHLYQAKSSDVVQMKQADLIFYNGLHLEGKMTEMFETLARERPVFAVGEYFEPKKIISVKEGAVDPHVWFDVSLWNKARGVVQEVLEKFDPQHADEYRQRGSAYQKKLDQLHRETGEKIASIPKQQRVLITAHDAFHYFGRAYGIDVRGIQGISTESEASIKHVTDLVNFIVQNKIKAVFVETTINERNMNSLIEGCKAQGHSVITGGTLYSDAMGPAGTPEGTYIGMVEHNVRTIVSALK